MMLIFGQRYQFELEKKNLGNSKKKNTFIKNLPTKQYAKGQCSWRRMGFCLESWKSKTSIS